MPPRKKNVLSTTVRWSAFEVGLFRYLATITHRSMADDLRAAIRLYARQMPGFDPEALATHIRRGIQSELDTPEERRALQQEVDAFVAAFDLDARKQRPTDIGVGQRKLSFASHPSHFDLD